MIQKEETQLAENSSKNVYTYDKWVLWRDPHISKWEGQAAPREMNHLEVSRWLKFYHFIASFKGCVQFLMPCSEGNSRKKKKNWSTSQRKQYKSLEEILYLREVHFIRVLVLLFRNCVIMKENLLIYLSLSFTQDINKAE